MKGWECPRRGRCYSPTTSACAVCGPHASEQGCLHRVTVTDTGGWRCLSCGARLPVFVDMGGK